MNWAIIEYETGKHEKVRGSANRMGIPCVIPMVTTFPTAIKHKKGVLIPALPRLLFIPANEPQVQMLMGAVHYARSVWRRDNGDLVGIPDTEFQLFLDRLERREKKPDKEKRVINMAEATELDWFNLLAAKFGPAEAIKRFGRDLRTTHQQALAA